MNDTAIVQGSPVGASGADVVTTRGDVIVGGVGGTPARLAVGSAGEVLTSDGTDVGWAAPAGGGDSDTYDMSSSTGITLTSDGSGSTARTASVTGGVLRLSVADGATASYGGGFTDPPWASVPLTDDEGRYVSRGRVRARLASHPTGPTPPAAEDTYQTKLVLANDAGTERLEFKLNGWAGTLRMEVGENASGSWTRTGSYPGQLNHGAITTGTLWCEYEWSDEWVILRYGLGADAVTPPTTWTERARVGLTLGGLPTKWSTLRLACDVLATGHGGVSFDWDDVTVERL